MAISLLGYLGNTGANAATSTVNKIQPLATAKSAPTSLSPSTGIPKISTSFNPGNVSIDPNAGSLASARSAAGLSAPMGVNAKSPNTNVSGPATTLPGSQQVIKPPATQTTVAAPIAPSTGAGSMQGLTTGNPFAVTQEQAAAGTAKYGTGNPGLLSQAATGAPNPSNLAPQAGDTYSSTNPPTSLGGLIGSALGQAQGYYNTQGGLTQQAQDIAAKTAAQEADLVGGYNGIGADATNSRIQQLDQFKNSAISSIQQQQAAQAGYESPLTTAYGNAISASQPQLGSYGQTYYNPLSATQGGSIQPGSQIDSALNQYAQMAANGQISAVPSDITSNPVLNAELNNRAKAINPNYNPVVSAAQGSATASNIQNSGTAATSAAAAGLQQATQKYVDANTSYTQASNQASNLQQTMSSTGINSNPQFINNKINSLQNQLGSVNYPAFITALSETQQAYTSLLAAVGAATPTVNGQQATDIFNANSTPAQINSAISALNAAAYAKLQPLYQQISLYQGHLGGNGTSNGTSSTFNW